MLDFNQIKEAAQKYEADMTRFLRDIVKFREKAAMRKPTLTGSQRRCAIRLDKVEIDLQGNVLGYMGTGKTLIGYDATSTR